MCNGLAQGYKFTEHHPNDFRPYYTNVLCFFYIFGSLLPTALLGCSIRENYQLPIYYP